MYAEAGGALSDMDEVVVEELVEVGCRHCPSLPGMTPAHDEHLTQMVYSAGREIGIGRRWEEVCVQLE